MNTQALITMIITNLVVAGFTAFFFWKVLKTPHVLHSEDDAE
ncbi:MAG: hypothetical protein SH848_11505 [Saprospiraceae bacterium]|nr:hypothetical protein [Saprospiraceae bacterium]MDZ4704549.1 hypothetical protein [Saprospiraceae bacterium]